MEYLFEFVLELVFESSVEASKNPRVPKILRYLLMTIIVLFFIGVIGIIFFTGILMLKENLVGGILFNLIGLLMLILGIIKFRKAYLLKSNKKQIRL